MSERIRRLHMKTPFDAKRVIVAGCAAIAMVLGAMSVGVSVTPNDRSAPRSDISSIVSSVDNDKGTSTSVSSTGLSQQHTLEVRDFLQQQDSPLYTTPPPAKASRNSLSPIFGTSNPVQFINHMVQLQQQQAQPANEDKGKDAPSTSETPSTSATPSEDPPASKGTSNPTSTEDTASTPSGDEDDPASPTIMRAGSSSSAPTE